MNEEDIIDLARVLEKQMGCKPANFTYEGKRMCDSQTHWYYTYMGGVCDYAYDLAKAVLESKVVMPTKMRQS